MLSAVNKKERCGWIHNGPSHPVYLPKLQKTKWKWKWLNPGLMQPSPIQTQWTKIPLSKTERKNLPLLQWPFCLFWRVEQELAAPQFIFISPHPNWTQVWWGKDRDRDWEREIEHSHRLKAALHPGRHLTATRLPFLPAYRMLYRQNTTHNIKP